MELPEFLRIFAVTKSGCRFLEVRGARCEVRDYSHSIVDGGFEEMS